MKENKRMKMIRWIVVGIFATICLVIVLHKKVMLITYDVEKEAIYINDVEPFLENVVNPSKIKNNVIYGVFVDKRPYIGFYDLSKNVIKTCIYIDELETELNEKIVIKDIRNVHCMSMEPMIISFLMNNKLYMYSNETGVDVLWEFSSIISENPYCWVNDEELLLLDEVGIIDDWKLWLLNLKTGDKLLIDDHVSAFVVAEEIVYGKKIYKGSWCEWELYFLNKNSYDVFKRVRNKYWSIGEIVYGEDRKIYLVSSLGGTTESNKKVYQYVNEYWNMRKVSDISADKKIIGIRKCE